MRAHILKTAEKIVMTYVNGAVLLAADHYFLLEMVNIDRHVTSQIV
jgi:hypothetical protein